MGAATGAGSACAGGAGARASSSAVSVAVMSMGGPRAAWRARRLGPADLSRPLPGFVDPHSELVRPARLHLEGQVGPARARDVERPGPQAQLLLVLAPALVVRGPPALGHDLDLDAVVGGDRNGLPHDHVDAAVL